MSFILDEVKYITWISFTDIYVKHYNNCRI